MAADSTHGQSPIDPENPVVKLCVAGMGAESQGRHGEARALFLQAWDTATDDLDACIAAHYVARQAVDPAEALQWNRVAVERADAVGDACVQHFYPSLYLNLGHSYETMGQLDEAKAYYALARAALDLLPGGLYDGNAAQGIEAAWRRMTP